MGLYISLEILTHGKVQYLQQHIFATIDNDGCYMIWYSHSNNDENSSLWQYYAMLQGKYLNNFWGS